MAIPLSQFVRTDEHIVKQPKVAMVNSTDTLPPKTRPLDTVPLFPPPTNVGEIGNYPAIPGDPTPEGDENFNDSTPTEFAVEYMVYVTDEGSGINVSSEEAFETIDGFEAQPGTATSNITLTRRDPQQGRYSLRFAKVIGDTQAGVQKEVFKDFSDYVNLSYFFDIYFTSLANVSEVRFTTFSGGGTTDFHRWIIPVGSLVLGWNTLELDVDVPDATGGTFDISNVTMLRWTVVFTNALATLSGIELDDFKGTRILSGKIETSDMKVAYARNSAWQTRFEFKQDLNRWALLNEDIGEVTNTPRLEIPSKYLNDWTNRAVDFIIEVNGTPFTVTAVANEAAFTNPPPGTVEFALAETTFNFGTSDLATYAGKRVVYKEIADDEVFINGSGIASFERNIFMTFGINPELDKKDLSLHHELEDEILSNSLSGTKEIPLTFVPITGSISMRYDPVPDGAPNPLVEGVDFVIDEDVPSIKFTKTEAGEVILSDFDTNPQSPGDPDSSLGRFDRLPLNFTDVVPNTAVLTKTGLGTLTEDVDYLVDLQSGTIFLTYGLVTEDVAINFLVPDTAFIAFNFTLYINGTPQDTFTLIPETGWVNLDRPLFEGDVVTVDYISEDAGPITGQTVFKSDGATELPVAAGGEFSFTVQNAPVAVTKFTVEADSTAIVLDADRTGDYVAGGMILMDEDYYAVVSSTYNAGADKTAILIAEPARRDYTNPTTYFTKTSVSWSLDSTAHGNIPVGVNTFTLTGGASRRPYYYDGVFIRIDDRVYRVRGSRLVNGDVDLEIILASKLTAAVPVGTSIYYTSVPIPTVGDTTLRSFYPPIRAIPDRYDSNGDVIDLDVRFPGLGSGSVKLIRNGVDLTEDLDYKIENDGSIKLLREPISASDVDFVLKYVPLKLSDIGDEITADYTHFAAAESGVGLRATLSYTLPDTFYFRVVNNNTQAVVFQNILREFIKQKTGQVSSGSKPSVPAAPANHASGMNTPITNVGDLYDNDLIAKRIYDFLNQRIDYLEREKMELCGEIVGGYTGPLTEEDVDNNALGSGRTFPVDEDITFAVEDKESDELVIPARPYRVPALFGMPVEDDLSRVVRDKEYPRIPIVTIPPFPPQGKRYKGSNNEPNAFGVLSVFGLDSSASAPTTFIENWYPYFLDPTFTNPFTLDPYITYSPTVFDEAVQEVNQDTGDPSTATPIFPPADKDLDPTDFAGFDPATFPMPSFVSEAPRDKTFVPAGYEAAALGALQEIDDAIEADTLKGTSHREVVGDPTSYPDSMGFVYRDKNEYDLLTNGTIPADTEIALIDAEWQGARPVNLATYQANIEQQLLVLNVQKASLERQITFLTSLINQVSPTPTGDPEATTVEEANDALSQAATALANVNAGLTATQSFYDDYIIGGTYTDAVIIARWLYLTGVDATGAPTASPLPLAPLVATGRVEQVEDRIAYIVNRLNEINTTLGFDNTATPTGFDSIDTSENLYTQRYTILDLRLNRESGTLFKARSAHQQYVKDINEASSLASLLALFGG
jgi:hypothetical protein